jgi:endonuclease/exonuclease/phosphatase (EEP) superfamily protein YafD
VLVLPWAAWAAARLLGLERGYPLVPLMAFAPYAAAVAVGAALVALALRRPLPALVAVAAAAALGGLLVPRVRADAAPDGVGAGGRLRVLTVNAHVGLLPVADLMALVRRERPDVLSVQELTPELDRALAAAGLGELLPSRVAVPRPRGGGMGLFARVAVAPLREPDMRNPAPAARLTAAGGRSVDVYAVHVAAPFDAGRVAAWKRDLRALPPAAPDGPPRILAGDFNATLDHAELRRAIDTGYEDAAEEAGEGLRTTWHGRAVWLPAVTIDHVLADARCGVAGLEILPLPGSDHEAVLAELILPR